MMMPAMNRSPRLSRRNSRSDAASSVASDLEFLRDNLGERFIAGIIIGADGSGYRGLGERVWEVPLSVLWELNTLNTPNDDPDGSPEE